jgi:hypothetical protein
MVEFSVTIQKFDKMGEKTGWTYILIPEEIALQIKPANRKSFRVKGYLDKYAIKGISLIPMGEGDFIMALNAGMRKETSKRKGDTIKVKLQEDKVVPSIFAPLLECLEDEPAAKEYFNSLPQSHRLYYSKWIESAKTDATRIKRLGMTVTALAKKQPYNLMIRAAREVK